MGLVNLFSAATGVNNWVDNVRTPKDLESGVVDLVAGVNIRLDKSGRPSRRGGYSLRQGGGFHSLFASGNECYVGVDTFIYRVGADLSLTGVRGSMSGARISYVRTPRGILYANGTNKGRLIEGVSSEWSQGEYVGPPTTRQFSGPPAGINHLEYFAGRVFGWVDNALVWSEPFNEDLWNPAKDFLLFPSRGLMVKSIKTGLFVSDEKRTYFLPGTDPQEFQISSAVAEHPALEWGVLPDLVPSTDLGLEGVFNLAVWLSPLGLVYGSGEGTLTYPTRSKINIPTGFRSGAVVRDGQNLIYTMRE